MSTLPPFLPPELVHMIFSIAANQSPTTAAILCSVSKWVQQLVEPLLYRRVFSLTVQTPDQCVGLLCHPKCSSRLESFGISLKLGVHPQSMFYAVWALLWADTPAKIRNMFVQTPSLHRIISLNWGDLSSIEELHLVWRPDFTIPQSWSRLRRIHIIDQFVDLGPNDRLIPVFPHQDKITHLALTVDMVRLARIRPGKRLRLMNSEFIRCIQELLDVSRYPSLRLLMVRVFLGDMAQYVDRDENRIMQSLKSASHLDRRLVFMVFPNSRPSREESYDEWEYNAERQESLWAAAEAQLSGSSVESVATDSTL